MTKQEMEDKVLEVSKKISDSIESTISQNIIKSLKAQNPNSRLDFSHLSISDQSLYDECFKEAVEAEVMHKINKINKLSPQLRDKEEAIGYLKDNDPSFKESLGCISSYLIPTSENLAEALMLKKEKEVIKFECPDLSNMLKTLKLVDKELGDLYLEAIKRDEGGQ